jgi:MFS family permease
MSSSTRTFVRDLPIDFRRLWWSSAATNLGDGALLAAGPLLVASVTPSPAAVGTAVFVQQLPWLLLSVLSGVAVDRVDRRRLVILVNTCRAAVMALLVGLILTDTVTLAALYVVLFLLGTGETLADNATSALVVNSVDKEQLGTANARLSLSFTLGNQLLGPPIGAFLFTVAQAAPIGLYAVVFLLGALLVARTRLMAQPPPPGEQVSPSTWVSDLKEGLTWLSRNHPLRTLIVSIGLMNLVFMCAFATWVLYATEHLGVSTSQFGLLITCSALGGLAGPWVYGLVEPRLGRAGIVRVGFFFEGAVHLILASTTSGAVVAATMLLFGVNTMVWGAASTTLRQLVTPDRMMGRVTSVYAAASIGGAALGSLIGAGVAEQWGLTAGFWIAGVAMLLIGLLTWRPVSALAVASRREE